MALKLGTLMSNHQKSIQTATAQISQIIANVASSQYGGCSADRIDELLAPFAERNYEKHLADAQEWIEGEERQKAFARKKTKKIFLMPCKVLSMKLIPYLLPMDKPLFTSLGFGLGYQLV